MFLQSYVIFICKFSTVVHFHCIRDYVVELRHCSGVKNLNIVIHWKQRKATVVETESKTPTTTTKNAKRKYQNQKYICVKHKMK